MAPLVQCRTVGLSLLAASILSAQDHNTFRSDVNLVQLSVIASDKQGKPVANLRQDEFQILEDGTPQDLRLFLAAVESAPQTASPRPPGVYTNLDAINARTGAPSGLSVLLIDNLNTDFGDPFVEDGTAWARVEALKMLHSLPEGERIAIYALRWKLQIVCDFTTNRTRLEDLLNKWVPSPDTPSTGDVGALPPAPPGLAGNVAVQIMSVDGQLRVDAINRQMDQLTAYLAEIPGRKNLLWIANRFNADPRKLARLARANVAIYPVDPAGVKSPEGRRRQMDAIADMSGGRAFYGRNDLDAALREAIDDGRVSYTLGYYRQTGISHAGVPHKLTVRVTRPGVSLRYRAQDAADATPPGLLSPGKGKVAALLSALNNPFDAVSLPVTAKVSEDNGFMDVTAVLDVASLDLQEMQGRWKGNVEVVVLFTAVDGKRAGESVSHTIALNLKPATYESLKREGFQFHDRFKIPPAPPAAADMKLMFGNAATGKAGSITVPISAGDRPALSAKKAARNK